MFRVWLWWVLKTSEAGEGPASLGATRGFLGCSPHPSPQLLLGGWLGRSMGAVSPRGVSLGGTLAVLLSTLGVRYPLPSYKIRLSPPCLWLSPID